MGFASSERPFKLRRRRPFANASLAALAGSASITCSSPGSGISSACSRSTSGTSTPSARTRALVKPRLLPQRDRPIRTPRSLQVRFWEGCTTPIEVRLETASWQDGPRSHHNPRLREERALTSEEHAAALHLKPKVLMQARSYTKTLMTNGKVSRSPNVSYPVEQSH